MNDTTNAIIQQYLTFSVSGDEYALPILRVREIISYDGVTRVPRTPPFIRGVINLRGSVVPVIDLARKFGYAEVQQTRSTSVVIVEVLLDTDSGEQQIVLGLLVDAVNEVMDLRPEDIQPPPSFGTRVQIAFLTGMGRSGTGFVLLLDIDKVLAAEDVVAAIEASDAPVLEAAAAELEGEPAA
jgi:purine-binding chemotaxis protein CheW